MTQDSDQRESHLATNRMLAQHYTDLVRRHGDSPLAAQYPDRTTQEKRFEILSQIGIPADAKILDFGCGLGDTLSYLRTRHGFGGEYVGYDLSSEVIGRAREKYRGDPRARFEHRDVFTQAPAETFDFVWVCGTFNIRGPDSDSYVRDALKILFAATRHGLAFNLMSTYVDFFSPDLHYANPDAMFRFCKEELSPCVTLRHDYMLKAGVVPYEFAVYVIKTPLEPRRNKAADFSRAP